MRSLDVAASKTAEDAPTVVSHQPLPALEPLLRDAGLAQVLRQYLGSDVRYDGHVSLRLTRHVSERNYTSSTWHHDR